MSNFFLCHYVFQKSSAAEASESVYMRERVNKTIVAIEYIKHKLTKYALTLSILNFKNGLVQLFIWRCPILVLGISHKNVEFVSQ